MLGNYTNIGLFYSPSEPDKRGTKSGTHIFMHQNKEEEHENKELLYKKANITIRYMKNKEELEIALGWAKEEGWNPGTFDYKSYFAADKKGFLFLLVDEEPVGCISLVKYQKNFAFIGLFIIKQSHRSKGLGKILWDQCLALLKDYSTGLYAVPAQISRYKTSGFDPSFHNYRWQLERNSKNAHLKNRKKFTDTEQVAKFEENELKKLFSYDEEITGYDRHQFLKKMIRQPRAISMVYFTDGTVEGYTIIRPCHKGCRITLYANNFDSAKRMTEEILTKIPYDTKLIFDIPVQNSFSTTFAEFFNLEHINSADTLAMFKGETPEKLIEGNKKCYGLASLELG